MDSMVQTTVALGLRRLEVRLVEHDPSWKETFELESKRIAALLVDKQVRAKFEHVGSTAIPGIRAKPIIDVLIGLPTADLVLSTREVLVAHGATYVPAMSRFGRVFLVDGDPARFHYILTVEGSSTWERYRGLRDFLSANPARTAYEQLKEMLAEKYPNDRRRYTSGKASFLEAIWGQICQRKQLVTVRRALRCV